MFFLLLLGAYLELLRFLSYFDAFQNRVADCKIKLYNNIKISLLIYLKEIYSFIYRINVKIYLIIFINGLQILMFTFIPLSVYQS